MDAQGDGPVVFAPMFIGLRIEVRTVPGALQGVPRLLRLLGEYEVRATFLFALGPDRSAWTRWPLGPEPLAERRRTAPLRAADPQGLLRGLLPPAPLIGPRAVETLRACRAAGHEIGVLAPDPADWESRAAFAEPHWTDSTLERAVTDFEDLLGVPPALFAAPGWQANAELFAAESRLKLGYGSDTRGRSCFIPQLLGVRGSRPQVPVTLPTLAELIGREGATVENLHQYVFAESQYVMPQGHCFAASAEIEGLAMLPVLERLLGMWRGAWGRVGPVEDLLLDLDPQRLPVHQVGWAQVPGRLGYVAMQGHEVPR
jgi:peptidoglycan/xylan/chitin deacetylase (PgdA/CDA1 family)